MSEPTVYVDTNILSVMHYRGPDPRAPRMKDATKEWWSSERPFFNVWASHAVDDEWAKGNYPGQEHALAEAQRLSHLPFLRDIRDITSRLLSENIVPASKPYDALQLAFATVHGIDYLLSWNRAHLVGQETQAKLALRLNNKVSVAFAGYAGYNSKGGVRTTHP